MKFQELTSAFQSESNNLRTVLSKDHWRKYKVYYDNLNSIFQKQETEILEEEIPFDLAKEVCELSNLKFYLYFKTKPHRIRTLKEESSETFEEVSSLDILLRFGGSFITETLQQGVSEVLPRQIGNHIEVLGAFNLAHRGMMAFLRTEKEKLNDNETICSLDNLREWIVINEPFMFVDPYSAAEKRERQIEQGIRQYIIKPIVGRDKPVETEILKRKTEEL